MDAQQIVAFLKALNAKKIKVKDNGWVEACCPLAPWTHDKGTDHTPSFGVSINPGSRSSFSCFSCRSGSVEELLHAIEMYAKGHTGHYQFAVCHQLLDSELKVLPLPGYGEISTQLKPFQEWPNYWLEAYQKVGWSVAGMQYLVGRGVTPAQAEQFELRFDPSRQMIVAPYWDVFGRLAGGRGRSILADVEGKSKHYDYTVNGSNNCRMVWFNEKSLNNPGPVVVVEGQFDTMRVALAHRKVVGNLTARPTLEKVKKLADSPLVVLIPDRDKAGEQSAEKYAEFCGILHLPLKILWLDDGVKDPAECHPEYLREKIQGLL